MPNRARRSSLRRGVGCSAPGGFAGSAQEGAAVSDGLRSVRTQFAGTESRRFRHRRRYRVSSSEAQSRAKCVFTVLRHGRAIPARQGRRAAARREARAPRWRSIILNAHWGPRARLGVPIRTPHATAGAPRPTTCVVGSARRCKSAPHRADGAATTRHSSRRRQRSPAGGLAKAGCTRLTGGPMGARRTMRSVPLTMLSPDTESGS